MADIIKIIPTIKGSEVSLEDFNECTIINEIKNICRQMEINDIWFQNESDNDLIDACIYQREVLNARYKYLINKLREKNPNSCMVSCSKLEEAKTSI